MRRNSFLLMLSLIASSILSAQNFQKTYSRSETDFNHFSVETAANGDLVYAGTIFDPDGNSIHIIRTDDNGNILCERTLDLSADDRAFDLTMDNEDRIVVTGYSEVNGNPNLIVAQFNADCECGKQKVVSTGFQTSAGTNIIYSHDRESYIIGGMRADNLSNPVTDNYAILLEFSEGSLNLINQLELSGSDYYHSSINDIVELPDGFFVTGSIDDHVPIQGVLAAWIDLNFTLSHHLNFESTTTDHVGVSASFDELKDHIYLMSNNSDIHNPQITIIEDATTQTPQIQNNYYLELDPSQSNLNAAGFELRPSLTSSDNLVAAGYFRTYNGDNTSPWLAEFTKHDGVNVQTVVSAVPSQGFHSHGGSGAFSTFAAVHPYIFNPEILTKRLDGLGFVFVGARLHNGNYSLEVISTDFDHSNNECLDPYTWERQSITSNGIWLSANTPAAKASRPSFSCSEFPSVTEELCVSNCVAENFQTTIHQTGIDHNHYSIETLDNCSYAVAGTEFKTNNNDIHVFAMSETGSVLWEKYIDISPDDRALDIAVDADGNLVVVGYYKVKNRARMYIAKFDASGNLLASRLINKVISAAATNLAATNVIYSAHTNSYIVGGMRSANFAQPLVNSYATLIELDLNLNYTGKSMDFFGLAEENSSINDIVELPNGFFVTGSIDMGSNTRAALAVFVNDNFGLVSNQSMYSGNSTHIGVSGVYDSSSDELYLLSNNSGYHNPQIATFGNASGSTPTVINEYVLNISTIQVQENPAGFQLRQSVFASDQLVAAGYFRTYAFQGNDLYPGGSDNGTCWVAEFKKSTGVNVNTLFNTALSPNFYSHGGGLFSTFTAEGPYVFTQEILTNRLDDLGYAFLAPRELGADFAVDVVSTDMVANNSTCLDDIPWSPISITHTSVSVNLSAPLMTTVARTDVAQNESSSQDVGCNITPKRGEGQADGLIDAETMHVYPNPTSDQVTVVIPSTSEGGGTITIMDALGSLVFSASLNSSQTMNFDLSDQQSGLYFIIYSDNDQRMISKVMKR